MPELSIAELAAALLQAAVTGGLAGLFGYLHRRQGSPHFFWWAVALGLYALGPAAIVSFLVTGIRGFLFWHQVLLGWTALGFLYAALVFSRRVRWRWWYLGCLAFPVVWSAIAIFVLDSFALAAGPAVVFLALTTGWTGVVFWRYRRATGSAAAGFLAATLVLWGIHHLDYPILRARGAWSPWGYHIDTLLVLAMAIGVLLLVLEEVGEGLVTLTALSGDLRRRDREDPRDRLLARPLGLRGVRGAALFDVDPGGPRLLKAVGDAGAWVDGRPPERVVELVAEVGAAGQPRLEGEPRPRSGLPPFTAALPLGATDGGPAVLVVIGDIAAPFAALGDTVLAAVGEQIGSALELTELNRRLTQRTGDLERLSVRMLSQHEDQRRRLSRELHDETAQVFSALKLQLGSLREAAPAALAARFDRLVDLVDVGTRSIRNVTDDLRPAVLEDLGLVPALRALIGDFREWSGLTVDFTADLGGRILAPEVELALFRAVQEALANVARHAQATRVTVAVGVTGGSLRLAIVDDGTGIAPDLLERLAGGPGRSGLFGMRERITALGGSARLDGSPGFAVTIAVPIGEAR